MHPTAACIHIYSTCVDFFRGGTTRPSTYPLYSTEYRGTFTKSGARARTFRRIGAAAICIVRNWQCFKLGVPRNLTLSYRFQPRANGKRKSSIKPWWSCNKFPRGRYMIARSELNGHLVLCIIAVCCENKNLSLVGKVVRVDRVSGD